MATNFNKITDKPAPEAVNDGAFVLITQKDSAESAEDVRKASLPVMLKKLGLTFDRELTWTEHYNIYCAVEFGEVVDVTPNSSSAYSYILDHCRAGDQYTVVCTGGQQPKAWAFLDEEYRLVARIMASTTSNETVTAPVDGWFIANHSKLTTEHSCVKRSAMTADDINAALAAEAAAREQGEAALADSLDAESATCRHAIAPDYADTETYDPLRYGWSGGKLYRSLLAIGTAEAWDETHWKQVDAAGELEMILAVLQGLRPGKELAFSVSNGTVALGVDIGSAVNITPTAGGSYKYIVEPCKQGDIFRLTNVINSTHTVRGWGFVDDGNRLMDVAAAGTSVSGMYLVAPCDGHFIAHTLGSAAASSSCVEHAAAVTIGRLAEAEAAIDALRDAVTDIRAEAARDEAAANGTYPGRDLTQVFLAEIGGYDDEWQWLHARIQAGNFAGIRIGDYIPVTCANGFTFNARVAGINTYKGSGASSVPNHIDFFGDKGWPTLVKMNPADNNNGISGRTVPFMASNAYYYLNSEAGSVPNSATAPTETVDVDYTADGVYYNLPAALKAVITAKRVNTTGRYSATGLVDSGRTSNSIVIGKLWLPFEPEVSGCAALGNLRDAACGLMRYPLFQNWPGTSIGRATDDIYWLASAAEGETAGFVVVRRYGDMVIRTASTESKLPICFRVT